MTTDDDRKFNNMYVVGGFIIIIFSAITYIATATSNTSIYTAEINWKLPVWCMMFGFGIIIYYGIIRNW